MELHFIINERAGNGKGAEVWRQIQNELTVAFHEHVTEYAGHGTEIAQKICAQAAAADKHAIIIAIGGDGTVHEVVNGIGQTRNVFIGTIKAGSGNDFARGFRHIHSVSELEEAIGSNRLGARLVDCGQLLWEKQNIRFINNCGIGFDASVVRSANASNLKKKLNGFGLGKLSYIYYVLKNLFTFQLFELVVEHEGKKTKFKNVWFATVSNQPYFGGGMKISPPSLPDDGLLELSVVSNLSRFRLLLMFGTVFFGKHTSLTAFTQLQSERFTLYINNSQPCHADGEIVGVTKDSQRVDIAAEKQCLSLLHKK